MKKTLVFTMLLFAVTAFGQTDIISNGPGPYYTLGQGLAWGNQGRGGTDNAYIVFTKSPSQNVCLNIRNDNPMSSHTFDIQAFVSSQPDVNGFYSRGGSSSHYPGQYWNLTTLFSQSGSVGPLQQANYLIRAAGQTAVAFLIYGTSAQTGNPDSGDIFAVATSAQTCGAFFTASAIAPDIIGTSAGASITPIGRTSGEVPTTKNPVRFMEPFADNTVGQTVVPLFFPGDAGQFTACKFEVDVLGITGTSPTLNVYIQDEEQNNANYEDMASFNQFTSVENQVTGMGPGSTSFLPPQVPTYGTMAAGSIHAGILPGRIQALLVLGGTSPDASGDIYGECQ